MTTPNAILAALLFSLGCASTPVRPVAYGDDETPGIRYYDPQALLIVTCETTQVVFVPHFQRGYTVEPRVWLAKNDFSIEQSNGMLSELATDMDSTNALTLLQSAATEALEAAGPLSARGESALAPIPGMAGIWRFDYDREGVVAGLTRISEAAACK